MRAHPVLVLMRLARFSPRYFLLCVLFAWVLFFWLPIPLGLATRALFDALAEQPAGLNAWSALALLVAVQVGELFTGPVLGNPWNGLQQKSHVLLRTNLFAGILRGFGQHGLPVSTGEAISRFRDDPEHIGDGLDALCDLIGRSLFAVGAGVVMWRISPSMTFLLLVPLLLTCALMEALGRLTMAYRSASREATGRVSGFLGEVFAAQLAVRVAGSERHALDRLIALGHARRHVGVRDIVFGELLDSLSINLAHVGTGLVLLLGAQAIRDGTFTVGDFALFVVYLEQLAWYPAEIGRLLNDLKHIEVSTSRMRAVVPGEAASSLVRPTPVYLSRPAPALPSMPPRDRLERLEVRGLTFTYPGTERGIADVSFTLERGSFTVITGRIGAGKSTLLHVLLGLLPRERGQVLWNGRPVDEPATFLVPPRAALTPQIPRLFSESLRDNIVLGWSADRSGLDRALRAAVLEPDLALLEGGLDQQVGPRGVKLSGGQVQRAAAARMFVRDAELLVLDDLSSALDTETESIFWQRLFARGRDVTCLVVSYRPAALGRADQVLWLEGGRLSTAGVRRSEQHQQGEIHGNIHEAMLLAGWHEDQVAGPDLGRT